MKKLKIVSEVGKKGEDLAAMFLMKQGFEIVCRNYLKKWGEIDIVARKKEKLYFVEVKSVSCKTLPIVSHETGDYHRPEDNVHPLKLKKMGRVIESYLSEETEGNIPWQIDVITVHLSRDQQMARVERISNIVL